MSWEDLVINNNYQINTIYPYKIRKKLNKKIVKESLNKHGYVVVHLNRQAFYKHRLITIQFIPNPHNLTYIDHINRIRTDNRIENLHWVSVSENNYNKSSYRH